MDAMELIVNGGQSPSAAIFEGACPVAAIAKLS